LDDIQTFIVHKDLANILKGEFIDIDIYKWWFQKDGSKKKRLLSLFLFLFSFLSFWGWV